MKKNKTKNHLYHISSDTFMGQSQQVQMTHQPPQQEKTQTSETSQTTSPI